MEKYFKHTLIIFFLLFIPISANCSRKIDLLIIANKLKETGFLDGQTGTISSDLNDNGYQDAIEYTFISTTPPGTCDQSDCMSNLSNAPTLTFQIKMHDGDTIDGPYMCTSLGVSKTLHRGMKDIICGPKYILRWNGEGYDAN
ncbi:hypothetical protein ACLBW0_23935 [Enterobacteriaceae bacterium C34A]